MRAPATASPDGSLTKPESSAFCANIGPAINRAEMNGANRGFRKWLTRWHRATVEIPTAASNESSSRGNQAANYKMVSRNIHLECHLFSTQNFPFTAHKVSTGRHHRRPIRHVPEPDSRESTVISCISAHSESGTESGVPFYKTNSLMLCICYFLLPTFLCRDWQRAAGGYGSWHFTKQTWMAAGRFAFYKTNPAQSAIGFTLFRPGIRTLRVRPRWRSIFGYHRPIGRSPSQGRPPKIPSPVPVEHGRIRLGMEVIGSAS